MHGILGSSSDLRQDVKEGETICFLERLGRIRLEADLSCRNCKQVNACGSLYIPQVDGLIILGMVLPQFVISDRSDVAVLWIRC